jgi:ABC-type phosphate transport system substrate-binding protein
MMQSFVAISQNCRVIFIRISSLFIIFGFFFIGSPISLVYNLPEFGPNCTDFTNIGKGCLMLSQEMMVGIFNGTIKKWNDPLILARNSVLASVNETIVVVVRADGSGTTGIFTRALAAFNPNWNTEKSQQFTDGTVLSNYYSLVTVSQILISHQWKKFCT